MLGAVVADLSDKTSIGGKRLCCLFYQGWVEIEALSSRKKRFGRLMLAYLARQTLGIAKSDIGRVADDQVERVPWAAKPQARVQKIGLDPLNPPRSSVALGISSRVIEG